MSSSASERPARRQAPLNLLELRGEVPRGWYFGAGGTFIGMFLRAWIAATAAGIVAPMFLPSPGAVLAELGVSVYTIEIVPGLASRAAERLKALGYTRVAVRAGDGYRGWPEAAPFDAIAVTAGATHIPEPLVAQLAEGGRLVIPVGAAAGTQELIQGRKTAGRMVTRVIIPVRFVPLVEPRR